MSGPATNGDPALRRWCDRVLQRERQVIKLEADMLGAKIAGDGHALADLRQRLASALAELEEAKVAAVAAETKGLPPAAPSRGGGGRSWR